MVFVEMSAEYGDDKDELRRFYLLLASAHGVSGRKPAQQNFIDCDVIRAADDGFLAGMELRVGREPFVPHHRDLQMQHHPLRCQAYGALKVYTEDALASMLVASVQKPLLPGEFEPPNLYIAAVDV